MKVYITEEDDLVLSELGRVTGEVIFTPAFRGTYMDPPESAEVQIVGLRDAFGIDIPEEFWTKEDRYFELLDKTESIVESRYGCL
jgi:hypothetical protein